MQAFDILKLHETLVKIKLSEEEQEYKKRRQSDLHSIFQHK